MIKRLIKKILPSPLSATFHIGFIEKDHIEYNATEWYKKVKWIDDYSYLNEGCFADPFFYSMTEKEIVLFAEHMCKPFEPARLVKMTIRRGDYKLLDVTPILTLDTHLSFPIIWREEGKEYVYPENNEGGALTIWEFDGKRLVSPRVIIKEPLVDSQLLKIGEEFFVMGVRLSTGTWNDTRELQIYKAKSLFGPYEHMQTIKNTINEERGGGEIINLQNGKFLRPAQRCVERYGSEIIMYEMSYDGKVFTEKELYRIRPDLSRKNSLLLHTYNEMNGLVVIDGLCADHPILYRLSKMLRPSL